MFREEKPDIIYYGHSHILDIREEEDILCINPGSFSKRRKGKNSCIRFKIDGASYSFDIVYV